MSSVRSITVFELDVDDATMLRAAAAARRQLDELAGVAGEAAENARDAWHEVAAQVGSGCLDLAMARRACALTEIALRHARGAAPALAGRGGRA